MDADAKPVAKAKGFKAGLMIGLAAPLVFLGQPPRYEQPQQDNIGRAWKTVGESLGRAAHREKVRLRDRRA